MKKKYLAFRTNDVCLEIDNFDCYHETEASIAIPTKYIVELSDKEYQHINSHSTFIFLPILSNEEIQKEIKAAIDEAKKRAKQKAEAEARRRAGEKKRKATNAKKKKEQELQRLAELKKKYEDH
jgi:Skp family chaperone for outer membrane proteins